MSDALRDLLPEYALGLLDDAERASVEAALASDPALQSELDQYDQVLDALATAVPMQTPPADLGKRILQAASTPRRRIVPLWVGLAAAGLLLVVALGLLLAGGGNAESERIAQILADSSAQVVEISGSEGFTAVRGKFVIAGDGQQAVLQLHNLELLTPEKAYQLWLVRGDQDRASGLIFRPQTPAAIMLVNLPRDFETYRALGLTIEPAGGSPGPTTPPVFAVPLVSG